MIRQAAALAAVFITSSPVLATATAEWQGSMSNSCSINAIKTGSLGVSSTSLELDSRAQGGDHASVRTAVVGDGWKLKVSDTEALRNGQSALQGHHKAWIIYASASQQQVFQNTDVSLANQTGHLVSEGIGTVDLDIRSDVNKAQDGALTAGDYVIRTTLTCLN